MTLNGSARIDALKSTGLMDAGPQPALDAIATTTAEALAVPSAAVSLLGGDEQFLAGYTAAPDAPERRRPLSMSICKYTVVSGIPFIVDNATTHPLLCDHPVVLSGEIGAYAGIPLFNADDQAVGTLCTFEQRPRLWTRGQIMVLQDMADVAAAKIFGW